MESTGGGFQTQNIINQGFLENESLIRAHSLMVHRGILSEQTWNTSYVLNLSTTEDICNFSILKLLRSFSERGVMFSEHSWICWERLLSQNHFLGQKMAKIDDFQIFVSNSALKRACNMLIILNLYRLLSLLWEMCNSNIKENNTCK